MTDVRSALQRNEENVKAQTETLKNYLDQSVSDLVSSSTLQTKVRVKVY
jgi:hypothetical protein